MSQRARIKGTRPIALWVLIFIAAVLVVGLIAGVLIIYPSYQQQQKVEQRYQAGVAFQNVEDWDKALTEFEQVIRIDATYKDAQTRLAEVKAKQQKELAQAQAKAAQATATAQAQAEATAAAATVEAGIAQATSVAATATTQARATAQAEEAEAVATVEARTARVTSVAATATAQAKATVQAQEAKATATAEALAQLEAHYQKGLGYMNIGRWEEAEAELEQVFEVDPNYKDVQTQLAMANSEVMKLTPTATPTPSATPTPTVLFTDDFTDGAAAEWIQTHGTWIVVDGQYEGVGAGGNVDAWTYVGDEAWTDYSFQARVIFESGNGEMVFRSTEHWRNEYRLGIWWQQSPDYANHLGLSKYKQGVSTMLWDQVCPIPITNPVDVKVDVIGSKIRVYINGVKVMDIHDPDSLEKGRVGLGVVWDWRARFDDVQVKALTPP